MIPVKRRAVRILPILALGLLAGGCASVMEQIEGMMNLTKCEFRMVSVKGVNLAGIPIKEGLSVSDLGLVDLAKLQGAFAKGTLPLGLTLNLEARNPNPSKASMNRMAWRLSMDGNELTTGTLEKEVTVPPDGGVGAIPLVMEMDLRQVLSGKSFDSMVNLALNLAGEGSKPTRVGLKVKPSIQVAGRTLDYPGYVTLTRDFGGK